MSSLIVSLVLMTVIAYLWGSIPAGYWMGKLLRGKDYDIRDYGSHKIGATNVKRTLRIDSRSARRCGGSLKRGRPRVTGNFCSCSAWQWLGYFSRRSWNSLGTLFPDIHWLQRGTWSADRGWRNARYFATDIFDFAYHNDCYHCKLALCLTGFNRWQHHLHHLCVHF